MSGAYGKDLRLALMWGASQLAFSRKGLHSSPGLGHTSSGSNFRPVVRFRFTVLSSGGGPERQPRYIIRRSAQTPSDIGGSFEFLDADSSLNWPPDPARSEGASRSWITRRTAKFNAAVRTLVHSKVTPSNLDQLRFAAHEVSEAIGAHLAEDADSLPRGYRAATNGFGERGIAHGEVLFSPAFTAPAPDSAAIEKLANDLRTGWLRELVEEAGVLLHFRAAQERLK
jgi:hypothetical protein